MKFFQIKFFHFKTRFAHFFPFISHRNATYELVVLMVAAACPIFWNQLNKGQ